MSRLRKTRRLTVALACAALSVMVVSAIAVADQLLADGDGLTPVGDNNMAFGSVSCDADTSKNSLLAIVRQGGGAQVFKNGATVTLAVQSVTGPNASAVTASFPSGNTISMASNWESAGVGSRSSTVTSNVKIHPTSSGAGSATINYVATGVNASSTSNNTLTREDSMEISWTAGSCTPPDGTAPTSSASATKGSPASAYTFGDWTNQDVTVNLSGQDNTGGSGLKKIVYTTNGDTPSALVGSTYSSPLAISAEGTTTVKFVAIDNANNVESPVNSVTVKIDKTAPTVNCGSADTAWHAANVSIACTASDGPSGLADAGDASFNLTTSVDAGSEDNNASTNSRSISDLAGNSSTAGPVAGNKVDRKAPSVSCGSADNDWHAADVSIACTASDGGSGVAPTADEGFNLSTNVPAGTETADASTATKEVSDAVGNKVTAGPIGGNKVDKKGPAISCDAAPTFTVNQSPANVTGVATDGGSGPGSQPLSGAATTSSVGGGSVSLSASDAVGNQSSKGCSYSVVYNWAGFFQPIDMGGVFNRAKAGSAIPVKFSLDGTPQPGTNTPGDAGASPVMTSAKSVKIACPSSAPIDEIEQTLSDSTSGLKYDAVADQWVYVWKTSTQLASTCQRLEVLLADGTTKTANFQFTK